MTAAVLLVLVRFVLPVVAPEAEFFGMDAATRRRCLADCVFAVLIVLWWLFFSRAPWSERLIAIARDGRCDRRDSAAHPHLDSGRDAWA